MRAVGLSGLLLFSVSTASAGNTAVKWIRDSVEYQQLSQQTYGTAANALASVKGKKGSWAVVLDIDETVLDNSTYQLERDAYGSGFELDSWNAWCERRQATPIPGVVAYVAAARKAGAKVVFISNRRHVALEATQANLGAFGLWKQGDPVCLETEDEAYDKVARRAELRAGEGACSTGKPVEIKQYLGDSMTDFPSGDEPGADGTFGEDFFLFANPVYGRWNGSVTRDLSSDIEAWGL
jgi:5'-nucleotidase (lipoprotein e(P4) family)